MLAPWLVSTRRDPQPYKRFGVYDVIHTEPCSDETKAHMAELLRDAALSPTLLQGLARRLGWSEVERIVGEQQPTISKMQRGRFGEVLTAAVLEQQHGYTIPVRKLRFHLTPNQSLPATDVLALKLGPRGSITEVCYVESKLRTVSDHAAVIAGSSQLLEDQRARLPSIVMFVASRLDDGRSPLLNAFLDYLADRREGRPSDTFALGLCWDSDIWTEAHLRSLEQDGPDLDLLTVYAMRLQELRTLTDEVFELIGVNDLADDA
jgi:hypothetical protein